MKKINKKSVLLRQLVYQEIRSAILKGELAPGDSLVEMDLSEKLGVSRTPLREAMALLEHEKLIETIPYNGTVIAGFDRKEAKEIYDLRMVLEQRALELAFGNVPVKVLKELEQNILSSASMEDNWLPVLTAGNKLHATVARYSGNRSLEGLIFMFTERIHQYFAVNRIIFDSAHLKEETNEHLQIVQAFLKGDLELAKKEISAHISNSYLRTFAYFKG